MKFEHVPIPVGTDNMDLTTLVVIGGLVVAGMLVAMSAPRLFATVAFVGGVVAGGLVIG